MSYWVLLLMLGMLPSAAVGGQDRSTPSEREIVIQFSAKKEMGKAIDPLWLGFTPDDKAVIARLSPRGEDMHMVRVYNSNTGEKMADWGQPISSGSRVNTSTIAFDRRDGRMILLDDKSISERRLTNWKKEESRLLFPTPRNALPADMGSIWSVQTDESLLLLISGDRSFVELWEYKRPYKMAKYRLGKSYDTISAHALGESGEYLAISSLATQTNKYIIDIIDVASGRTLHSVETDVMISAMSVDDKSKLVVAGDVKGDLTIIDIAAKKADVITVSQEQRTITSLAIANGSVAYSVRGPKLATDVGVMTLNKREHRLKSSHNKDTGTAIVCLSSKADRVACVDYGGNIRIIRIK